MANGIYTITLAGQDITPYVQWLPDTSTNAQAIPNAQPVKIDSTLGQGAGTGGATSGRAAQATFLVNSHLGTAANALGAGTVPASPALVRQGEVQVTAPDGTVIFGGYAGKLDDATNRTQVYTQVSCYDYWQSLKSITINEIIDGLSDVATITYLVNKYAPWINLSKLPTFASGKLLGQVWRNKDLQWALQKVADITGRQIYITPDKYLLYEVPTQASPAPFSVSSSPDNTTSFPFQLAQFTVDDTQIINRVTLYGGKQATPDFNQDVSNQATGSNTTFMLAYYPRKSTSGKVIVTVNGAEQTLGYAIGTGAANTLKSQGGDCDVLLNADARTLLFDVAPASGASVICTYRYELPLTIQITEPKSYAFYGKYFDGTISDETVVDSATAIQRCRVLLLEQAFGLVTIKLKCWKAGLQAGQLLTIYDQVRGINSTYIVQEVVATPITPSTVEFEVTLGAWNWNLVDVLSQLAIRTNGNDTLQQETTNPIMVNVGNPLNATVGTVLVKKTRAMGFYHPGATTQINPRFPAKVPFTLPTAGTQETPTGTPNPAYPGLSSI